MTPTSCSFINSSSMPCQEIYIRDYSDKKNCVCPRSVPPPVQLYDQRAAWEGYTLPCTLVESFGLGNRDTLDFSLCV